MTSTAPNTTTTAGKTRRSGKRGNGEGSVTQLANGLWQARVTLEDGRRKAYYAKTRQEAAQKLTAALRDVTGACLLSARNSQSGATC